MVILIAAAIVLECWWWGQGVTHQTFSISVADVPQNKKKNIFMPLRFYVNEVNFDESRRSKTTIFAVL